MYTTTNVHNIRTIKITQKKLVESPETWITEIYADTGKGGDLYTLSLFSTTPLPIEGADLINFAASVEEA